MKMIGQIGAGLNAIRVHRLRNKLARQAVQITRLEISRKDLKRINGLLRDELLTHLEVTRALVCLREIEAQNKGEEWWAPEETPPECIAWCAAMDEAKRVLEEAIETALSVSISAEC